MSNFFKDILTALDGQSYAVAKVLGCLMSVMYILLSVASFIFKQPFDMVAFATGAGLVVGATCAAVKLTETSEPKPPETK